MSPTPGLADRDRAPGSRPPARAGGRGRGRRPSSGCDLKSVLKRGSFRSDHRYSLGSRTASASFAARGAILRRHQRRVLPPQHHRAGGVDGQHLGALVHERHQHVQVAPAPASAARAGCRSPRRACRSSPGRARSARPPGSSAAPRPCRGRSPARCSARSRSGTAPPRRRAPPSPGPARPPSPRTSARRTAGSSLSRWMPSVFSMNQRWALTRFMRVGEAAAQARGLAGGVGIAQELVAQATRPARGRAPP